MAKGLGGFLLIISQMSLLCYIGNLKINAIEKKYNHFIASKYWLML